MGAGLFARLKCSELGRSIGGWVSADGGYLVALEGVGLSTGSVTSSIKLEVTNINDSSLTIIPPERASVIGAMGATNVVDHVAADGSKNVAVSMDVADMGPVQAALASPPPELADGMRRHGVIPPVIAHVEK